MELSMNGNNSSDGLYEYYLLSFKKKNATFQPSNICSFLLSRRNSLVWVFLAISGFSPPGYAGTQACSLMGLCHL